MKRYKNTRYCDSPCRSDGWANKAPVQPYAGGYPPPMPTYADGYNRGEEHACTTMAAMGGAVVGAALVYFLMKCLSKEG